MSGSHRKNLQDLVIENRESLLTLPQWKAKRQEVLRRDSFRCRKCGEKGRGLQVHHLKYEPDRMPWEIDSGWLITLCEDCHRKEGPPTQDYYDHNCGSTAKPRLMRSRNRGRDYRSTHCYMCKKNIDSLNFNVCNVCGWILCACGACGCQFH